MATKVQNTQLAFDGSAVTRSRFRFAPGEYDELRELAAEHRVECDFHYNDDPHAGARVLYLRPERERQPIFKLVYDDPWDEPGNGRYSDTICEWCNDNGYAEENDFGPFYCERGQHAVIQRNPSNGWRGYEVNDPEADDDEYTPCCVGCAQRFYKQHGHPREQMDEGQRVRCDFYDHSELRELGWTEGQAFFRNSRSADELEEYHDYCLALIGDGNIVLTDQGTTGIGMGGPDDVTVWFKPS